MDPLQKVHEALNKEILTAKMHSLIMKRFPIVLEGINRIEKASGLEFPLAYVEPSVVITSSNSFNFGILYARTIPLISDNDLKVVIQITAPLVAFGLKGTIHAILAHEFLHYLELVRKVSKMEILSDEISGNLFEGIYSDSERLFDPRAVFNDKTLLLHITKKFPEGFRDYKLEDKVVKFWIEKQLPSINTSLDTNIVKIPSVVIANKQFESSLLLRLSDLEQKGLKLRRKKLY